MGKTSLVREAIREVNKEYSQKKGFEENQEQIKCFDFSLSQDDVKDIDLLRQIAWKLIEHVEDEIIEKFEIPKNKSRWGYTLNAIKKWWFFIPFFILLVLLLGDTGNYDLTYFWEPKAVSNFLDFLRASFNNLFKDKSIGHTLLFFGLLALFLSYARKIHSIRNDDILKTHFKSYPKKELRKLEERTNELKNRLFAY